MSIKKNIKILSALFLSLALIACGTDDPGEGESCEETNTCTAENINWDSSNWDDLEWQ